MRPQVPDAGNSSLVGQQCPDASAAGQHLTKSRRREGRKKRVYTERGQIRDATQLRRPVQSQLRELQLAKVQAAAVGKSDHHRSLRVRGDGGANEAQRAPQLEMKDQRPAAAEVKQQGLPPAADPFNALPSQRTGKCLRTVRPDGGWR